MFRKIHPLLLLVAGFIIFRMFTLSLYPLIDTTEARYGEIARIMVETGNWVTPQFDYDVPFWGKPPLHTWISAVGGKAFGISEFSMRLPHLLTSILTLIVASLFAKRFLLSVPLVGLVLTTTLGFFVASGMIMTDALLLLGMTMAMTGFATCWYQNSRFHAYIGFTGIGIGLLAKGPIIVVLIGLTLLPWLVFNFGILKGAKMLFQRIPLVSGFLLSMFIAVPWYLLAEQATPGFLNYFIIGEHVLRFIQSGWEGDLYGTAHSEPRGIIWLYWVAIGFPWSFFLIASLFSEAKRKKIFKSSKNERFAKLNSYLICWLISPMLLFTFSGNILAIYALPGIPALALLIARFDSSVKFYHVLASFLTPVLMVVYLIWFIPEISENKSDKLLLNNADEKLPLYYLGKRSFSGRFYTSGKAKVVKEWDGPMELNSSYYLVANSRKASNKGLTEACKLISKNTRHHLLLCTPQ